MMYLPDINRIARRGVGRLASRGLVIFSLLLASISVFGQNDLDGKRISKIATAAGRSSGESFQVLVAGLVGETYSRTKIHDAILAIYDTKRVDSVSVSAKAVGDGVELTFIIKPKSIIDRVSIVVGPSTGDKVTEQELLFKLNVLSPGSAITDQDLRNNADLILDYLRERGFFRSEVSFEKVMIPGSSDVNVVFKVTPNAQATVENFKVDITGFEGRLPPRLLALRPGVTYSREKLIKDIERVRTVLRKGDFVAPQLDDARVAYDSDTNKVSIELSGTRGPVVDVSVDAASDKAGDRTLSRLLPVKREGTLDFAAIIEGERRLANYYQEKGYFFAAVTPICSVDPPISDVDRSTLPNGTEFVCSALAGSDLSNSKVELKYRVDLKRKLRLKTIRIRGTKQLTYADVATVLNSQAANILGVIPIFGYGRGVTSLATLEEDAATIRSLMNELGYRDALVRVNQGVSPNGEDLVITFEVEEGPPTKIDTVSIVGNSAIQTSELLAQLPMLNGRNYSRARIRNAVRSLQAYYSAHGYYDAHVVSSISETPQPAEASEQKVKLEFKVESEGRPVVIDRVLVTGNTDAKTSAIERALTLKPGNLLRSADVYSSEQNLFETDAFDRVEIKLESAGTTASGDRKTDVIVNVNEQAPRLMNYGGGYSTDVGLNGFFDIRHIDLFGKLWQGGFRVRMSQRQQLGQIDFVNPRFLRDKGGKFAPLTITAQYQRDSTVTRFFRSAFDKGTFGIVQRIDANGNAIDEFGNRTGSPTINRLTFSAETSRTLSVKNRSLIFARFKFEDVRLLNINSLLVRDLLRPDSRIRTSGFSFTYVRDTRQNCSVKYSLLQLIAKGEPGDPCRYNASDPTKGNYITAQYDISIPFLGANTGFHKFQASYNFYYTFKAIKSTTIAGRAVLGLAEVFSNGDRFPAAQFPGLDGILPISERFFAGGSTTLRGFNFEEAGPRAVIVPQGTFLNSTGQAVFLDPFTLPFGGNGLAIINLEARIPLSKSIRAVPFYDGGNVFRKATDIFNPPNSVATSAFQANLRALWSHTFGLGFRIKTPIGGEFGIDYGYLVNPPRFRIPQVAGPDAIYQLKQGQLHFRFSQAF